MANSYLFPNLPKFYGKGDKIIFPISDSLMTFPYTKMIREMKMELWGNIAYYGCPVKGGYVFGTMDYKKYATPLYIYNPPSDNQGGHHPATLCIGGPTIVSSARVANYVATRPDNLYYRFIAAGGAGGDARFEAGDYSAQAWGGGWIGGTDTPIAGYPGDQSGRNYIVPGFQSGGGWGNNASGYFGYAGDDDGWARFDNSGGGWWGGGEGGSGRGTDTAAGGSSYAAGDPHCTGTQTLSPVRLTDTGTIPGISSGCRVEFTVTKPGWQPNQNGWKMKVRKTDGNIFTVTLFETDPDIEFPTDGSMEPLYTLTPDGKKCFAVGYPYQDSDYAYLTFMKNGRPYYVVQG